MYKVYLKVKITSLCKTDDKNRLNQLTYMAKVHIVDGFMLADNMEHFAKATFQK